MFQGLLAVTDTNARGRLDLYLDCLQHWSEKINLTGAKTKEGAFETLVLPVLGAEALLTGPVIDVGSGNGSPGLILAALRPDLKFTLLEPRAKRWAFLREAAREMGVENVSVRCERSDGYQGDTREDSDDAGSGAQPGRAAAASLAGGQRAGFWGSEPGGRRGPPPGLWVDGSAPMFHVKLQLRGR